MRPKVEALMGVEVRFIVTELRVSEPNAFFSGRPVHRDGREFSAEEVERAFDGAVHDGVSPTMAWLVRRGDQWIVRSLLINQSDAWGMYEWCRDAAMRRLVREVWSCENIAR